MAALHGDSALTALLCSALLCGQIRPRALCDGVTRLCTGSARSPFRPASVLASWLRVWFVPDLSDSAMTADMDGRCGADTGRWGELQSGDGEAEGDGEGDADGDPDGEPVALSDMMTTKCASGGCAGGDAAMRCGRCGWIQLDSDCGESARQAK